MLIVEEGTGTPDAESYASADDLATYAVKFGAVLPADSAAQEALLRRAALVMEGMTWKGAKKTSRQALAWPRTGFSHCRDLNAGEHLPARIRNGQMALAIEIHADDIDPIEQRKGAVVRERVEGAVDTEYAVLPNSPKRWSAAVSERPSASHFAELLARRGPFAVRA